MIPLVKSRGETTCDIVFEAFDGVLGAGLVTDVTNKQYPPRKRRALNQQREYVRFIT
jgi:hypothetical protein